jgi:hypothetical protein
VTHEQGQALEMTLKAQFGVSVLVLSNNIQLVKLKPIPEATAQEMMKEGADVIHYSKEETEKEAESQERPEGDRLRAEGGPGPAPDLRSAGAAGGDSESGEGEENGGGEKPPKAKPGPTF